MNATLSHATLSGLACYLGCLCSVLAPCATSPPYVITFSAGRAEQIGRAMEESSMAEPTCVRHRCTAYRVCYLFAESHHRILR